MIIIQYKGISHTLEISLDVWNEGVPLYNLCNVLHNSLIGKHMYNYRLFEEGDTKLFKIIVTTILEPFSFLAHLGVLPLLFLQFLSTYAWVCVFGDKYCREGEPPNQLQIDRTGVLFGFFICAGVIGFAARVTNANKSSA